MLSPADSSLIHRDTELSGLTVLFDPNAFATALQPYLPEVDLSAVRSTYVRYKKGTNCIVAYELDVTKTKLQVYAKAFSANSYKKLQKFKRLDTPGELGVGCIILEDYGIAVCFFPNDKDLEQLPRLTQQNSRQQLLQELLPTSVDLQQATLSNVRYKPERRYVGLCTLGGSQVVLKAYTKEDYPQAKANAQSFVSRGILEIAPNIGYSDRNRLLAFNWIHQLPLNAAIAQPNFNDTSAILTGAALAEVHAQNPANLNVLNRNAEAQSLLAIGADLSFVCPQIAHLTQKLAKQLAERLLALPQLSVPIHGDFNAEQVLLGQDTVTFLDFDRAVRSDPAADLGSFIARIEHDKLRGNLSLNHLEKIKEALLQGYHAVLPDCQCDRIELYTAIGLFRLASEPFRYRESCWDTKTAAILQRAETLQQSCASTLQSA